MANAQIGKRIKECRENLGLTQEQFSEKTGLSTNYISAVERGAAFPTSPSFPTFVSPAQSSRTPTWF